MSKLMLVKPQANYIDEIQSFKQEFTDFDSDSAGDSGLSETASISDWIEQCRLMEDKETIPNSGWVEAKQYMLVQEGQRRILGMINFRHYLNEYLAKAGGHIGYSVRPTERNKGYAKIMLALCLEKCKEFGLKEVLICCYDDNKASKRAIVACGGVFDKTTNENGKAIELYRVMLFK